MSDDSNTLTRHLRLVIDMSIGLSREGLASVDEVTQTAVLSAIASGQEEEVDRVFRRAALRALVQLELDDLCHSADAAATDREEEEIIARLLQEAVHPNKSNHRDATATAAVLAMLRDETKTDVVVWGITNVNSVVRDVVSDGSREALTPPFVVSPQEQILH
jgi:hypothetical protein